MSLSAISLPLPSSDIVAKLMAVHGMHAKQPCRTITENVHTSERSEIPGDEGRKKT